MTDCFALLELPRRPWIDPDQLKEKFLARSARLHPDRVRAASKIAHLEAEQRYAELNAAYHCLRHPKDRLQHLLELELGARPTQVQNIPPDLMNLFLGITQLLRQTDAFLKEKAAVASSPLLQVQLFAQAQTWTEKLRPVQQRLNGLHENLLAELKELDAQWSGVAAGSNARAGLLARLDELYRLFGYFTRWSSQVQERLVQLSF